MRPCVRHGRTWPSTSGGAATFREPCASCVPPRGAQVVWKDRQPPYNLVEVLREYGLRRDAGDDDAEFEFVQDHGCGRALSRAAPSRRRRRWVTHGLGDVRIEQVAEHYQRNLARSLYPVRPPRVRSSQRSPIERLHERSKRFRCGHVFADFLGIVQGHDHGYRFAPRRTGSSCSTLSSTVATSTLRSSSSSSGAVRHLYISVHRLPLSSKIAPPATLDAARQRRAGVAEVGTCSAPARAQWGSDRWTQPPGRPRCPSPATLETRRVRRRSGHHVPTSVSFAGS